MFESACALQAHLILFTAALPSIGPGTASCKHPASHTNDHVATSPRHSLLAQARTDRDGVF